MGNALHISVKSKTGKYKSNQKNAFKNPSEKLSHDQRNALKKLIKKEVT